MTDETKARVREMCDQIDNQLRESNRIMTEGPLGVETLALANRLSNEAGLMMVEVDRLMAGVAR